MDGSRCITVVGKGKQCFKLSQSRQHITLICSGIDPFNQQIIAIKESDAFTQKFRTQ
jgi:hypothetical protein